MRGSRHARPVRLAAVFIAAVMLFGAIPIVSAAHKSNPGFKTSRASMLDGVTAISTVEPLLSVGDPLPNGGTFQSIPDGLSLRVLGGDDDDDDDDNGHRVRRVELYVNHETSTVPFPYNPTLTDTDPAESQNDFRNAEVSRLLLNGTTAGIQSGKIVIGSNENFQRFCSNFLVGREHGFNRPTLFTNEEAIDWVNRQGRAWPATVGASEARQAGVVVMYDVLTGKRRPIWGMGRLNHENSVALKGYRRKVVLVTGDDTFTNNPSQSQLYAYIARDRNQVWNDKGKLYVFAPDNEARNTYESFSAGDTSSITGKLVEVPRLIATGRHANGRDIMSTDPEVDALVAGGVPPPPNGSSAWQQLNGVGIDGPQWVLDYWSKNVGKSFNFIRVEDTAYDKRPGMSNVLYIADSGRASGVAPNGRIWRMVFDKNDPKKITSLSILVEGDNSTTRVAGEIHQPDNLETTPNGSLLVTEDPSTGNQFAVGAAGATTARLWQVFLATYNPAIADSPTKRVVASVNQSQDEVGGDVDPPDNPPFAGGAFAVSPGNLGAWESSGVVDASAAFGPGAFLITVQAHTRWVQSAPGDLNTVNPPASPDFTYKLEDGQLLLLRIPGA